MSNIDAGPSAPGLLIHARTTITSAQVLAISGTPITLVPAYGPNTIIALFRYNAVLNFVTTAYSATALSLYWGNSSGPAVAVGLSATMVSATSSQWQNSRGDLLTTTTALSGVVNEPLVFTGAASPTLGDGTFDIDVWYTIIKP